MEEIAHNVKPINCIIITFRLWIIKNLLWLIIIVIVLELEWNADGIGYMYIQAPLFSIGSSMVLLVLEKSLREAVRSR